MKPTLGVDPGFRTGCKVAAVDPTGKFLEYQAVFPHQGPAAAAGGDHPGGLIRKHQD
jgi:uncharacterized protein